MKNNRGQALVEFIMILPILILFIMAVFDFANILLKKNEMNDDAMHTFSYHLTLYKKMFTKNL